MNFSKRLNLFGDEIFAALNERRLELEKQGKKIYNMSVGTPDFHTPDHIKKALMEAAADDQNWRYSLRDLPELLDAVCAYYKKRFHVEITPDMVMSVYGSQEGMGHLGMTLCDEGDVVLLPDPCYPVFAAGSKLGGAVPYYYPLVAEHDFLPYVKDIPEDVLSTFETYCIKDGISYAMNETKDELYAINSSLSDHDINTLLKSAINKHEFDAGDQVYLYADDDELHYHLEELFDQYLDAPDDFDYVSEEFEKGLEQYQDEIGKNEMEL